MKNNKIVTFLLALAISLGLWFYVVTVVKPDTTNTYYNIPVVLDGESFLTENSLMIVGARNTTVTMELYGNRTDLDKVNSGNITLIADLSKIRDPGEIELPYSYRFPGDVPSGALSVQSKIPGTIKLTIAKRDETDVPVKLVVTGEAPDESMYIVDKENPVFDQNSIHISGPEDVIAQIDHAAVVVDVTGRTESFKEKYRITLCDKDGNGVDVRDVSVSAEEVETTLNIHYYKDIRLSVDVVDGGGATRATSSITIDPVTIKVSGSKNVLSKMTDIPLGTIDLSTLTEAKDLSFPITLNEGLTNMSGVTDAKVSVNFPNLGTKELSVTNIQALNVPEGMSYDLLAKALKVTVRGPKDVIDKVTANDVTVTVELAGEAAGTRTYKPAITVNTDKYPNVGVIGTYSVGVTLTEGVATVSEEPTE